MTNTIMQGIQHARAVYNSWRDDIPYETFTTFFEDFEIAERFGINAIKDTYKRAFKSWKNDVKYITELTMILNIKIWGWTECYQPYAELYQELWEKTQDWCFENLKGEDLNYFISTTD